MSGRCTRGLCLRGVLSATGSPAGSEPAAALYAGHFDGVDGIDGIDDIIIIGMPPHMIAIGMPEDIMLFIISQRSRIMSIMDALAGFIFIIMPSGIISQDT